MKVAIVHAEIPENAAPDDLDTLEQAEGVARALEELGHEAVTVTFSLDLKKAADELGKIKPDIVFNLVESVDGSGRLIHLAPSLFDHLSIPYTGCGSEAMFTTSNKILAKKILDSAGLPTPSWLVSGDYTEKASFTPGKYIVKSALEHASVGLDEDSVIRASAAIELLEIIADRESRGGQWYAERFVDGREFNVPMLAGSDGPRILPVSEIVFDAYPEGKERVVGYRAKWEAHTFEYQNTPRRFDFAQSDLSIVTGLKDIALRCWELFSLDGYTRVDFRVDENGKPWILEINANPCITPEAGFEASATQAGLVYTDIVKALVDDAVIRGVRKSGVSSRERN